MTDERGIDKGKKSIQTTAILDFSMTTKVEFGIMDECFDPNKDLVKNDEQITF